MAEYIAFIGLGIMGSPMAKNLLKAGYSLIVRDIRPEAEEELRVSGSKVAVTSAEAAANASIVITMLPDTPQVIEVMRGAEGIFEGAKPGTLIVDMSTISPIETRGLATMAESIGLDYLDAPVSGGQVGAENATLSIMVGGKKEAFTRALPVFQAMGKNIVYIGDHGAGQVCKACNQVVVALTIEAVGEALVLAQKAGVSPAKVREALLGGFAQSRILDLHGQRALDRNFRAGFRVYLHQKDLSIALETSKNYGAPLPLTAMVAQMFTSLIANDLGEEDHSVLITFLEKLANTEIMTGMEQSY